MQAGSLEISFLTNLAQLKSDMDQADRAVAATSASAGRSLATMNNGMAQVVKTSQAMRVSIGQIPDVISGLATGQKPMTIFIQQGLQIVQVAQMAEGGLRGFAGEVGALALRFAPLLVVLALVGGAVALFTSRMSDDEGLKAYANSLGLTHKEMKKLGDVSVTTGDVIQGTWKTLVDALDLSGPLGGARKLLGEAADWAVHTFQSMAAAVYALFVGGYRAIEATWRQWPAVLGDIFLRAVNGSVAAIEFLLNKSIDGINALATGANKLTGLDLFGQLGHTELGRMQNQYAAAAADAGKAAAAAFSGAYAEGLKGITAVGDKLFSNINAAARERIKTLADGIIADRTAKAAKANKDAEKAAKLAADIAAGLVQAMGERALDLEKVMDAMSKSLEIKVTKDSITRQLGDIVEGLKAVNDYAAQLDFEKATEATDRMRQAAAAMADAWGHVGRSIGDAINVLADYTDRQAELDKQKKSFAINDQVYAKKSADLQLNSLMSIAEATEGLFKKHSAGAKAAQAAEKALAAVELARTIANVAGAAAKMFQVSGPAGFGLVAAMLAVMASLGFHGGGGGATPPATNEGKGTTLGDSDHASDSLKRSIDLLADVDRVTMQHSAEMATSLKSIDAHIGSLASLLVRSGNINGATAGVQTGFKANGPGDAAATALLPLNSLLKHIPVVGDIVSGITGVIKSLFGTKTSVVGSGIYSGSQNLAGILNGGFDLQTYADIQKKKKFLGMTTGVKNSTQYGAADPQVEAQFGLILKSFYDAIGAAAVPLGKSTSDVEHQLDSFVVNLGKIDFTGLSGDEIQKKLEAVFGAAADNMASAAFPGIEKWQQVGEGAFETLTRVASTVEAVTSGLDMLGKSTSGLGLDAKMAIAGLFDGVDAMTSATQAYFTTFYTDAEQSAMKLAQLTSAFTSMGVALPDTLASYRALVDAQDLTTAAGQEMYAALIQLAPAFASIKSAAQDATSAAAILREGQDLRKQLLQEQGDTPALRALELAAINPANQAIQKQIWALQDQKAAEDAAAAAAQARAAKAQQAAQAAAQAADQLRQAWRSIADGLLDEVKRIRGLTDTPAQGYAALLAEFDAQTAAARAGNQDAAKDLPNISKALLDAAALVATSQQELARIQGMAANSLESTAAIIAAGAFSANDNRPAPFAGLGPATGPQSTGAADLVAEVRGLRAAVDNLEAKLTNANATIAANTGKTARILENVTSESGGNAISTEAA